MKFRALVAVATILVGCTASTTTIAQTGAIAGTVKYEGPIPKFRPIRMSADPVCEGLHKEPLYPETLVLGDGNTMANILVYITEGLPKRKEYPTPKEPVDFTQEGCMYSPHVLAVRRMQPVRILNPDGTLHNVHALPEKNSEFNKAMTKTRTELIHVFRHAEDPFPIKCEVHNWMSAYCAVFDHPFFDVTETDGKFKIEGLEPGTYTIKVWHERLGDQTAEVTVEDGETATADFTYTPPKRGE